MRTKIPNTIKQNVFIKHQMLLFIHLMALSLLSGCSTTSEVFECEAGKGIGCKSISQVNKMVDQGQVGGNGDEPGSLKVSSPVFENNTREAETRDVSLNEAILSDQTSVNRVREEHLRVWIAPFQDEQGNLHEGSVVHTVVRPGYWQLTLNDEGAKYAE